eukprot:TRINITY_DN47816_c0_g1_i1.p3 TRINITY_DN47816_c0_g1~~TRINITY_DN47816_c0_g1_i1.p3  ORF type:complete len:192 (+),score=48.39 TRINITY_DN47816_c0_g1_i1:76-576(+)
MDGLSPVAPRSSLVLELLLWLDGHLTKLLVVISLLLLVIKPYFLRYPPYVAVGEALLLLSFLLVQRARLWLGSAGNKREKPVLLAGFLWATFYTSLAAGYFWKRQTYGLLLEAFLAAAAVGLSALEALGVALLGVAFCDHMGELLHITLSAAAAGGALLLVFLAYD